MRPQMDGPIMTKKPPRTPVNLRFMAIRLLGESSIPGKHFRFEGKLFSLDGSLIDLSMKVLRWTDVARKKAALWTGADPARGIFR